MYVTYLLVIPPLFYKSVTPSKVVKEPPTRACFTSHSISVTSLMCCHNCHCVYINTRDRQFVHFVLVWALII